MSDKKQEIKAEIERMRPELLALSHQIHRHPELGFEERQAVALIGAVLKEHGFEVELGYCGVETSFRAVKKGRDGSPRIAFLAEYDALRGIGHGCGHNVIATCAVGAFLGLAKVMDGLDGEIAIIGTPAEEGGAGKAVLLTWGGFDRVDFALMMHPAAADYNLVNRGGRASSSVKTVFLGKAAHSSTPSNGINALTSAISLFNQLDGSRPLFEAQDNINGVILEGGVASNVICERAVCEFCIRSGTMKRVEELRDFVTQCAVRAAALTGAVLETEAEPVYAERYPNLPMCRAFKANMESLGIPMEYADPAVPCGSSDIGNVSIRIPAIHDYLSITRDPSVQSHSAAFTEAAASPMADEVCILGAEGLAMTALDILESEEFRQEIHRFHREQIPEFYQERGAKR